MQSKPGRKDEWIPAAVKLTISTSIFLLMPSYLDIISRQFGAPIEQLTYLATVELIGLAIAPFLCLAASKFNFNIKENYAIVILAISHLASVFCESVEMFFFVRSLAGVCAGIILVRSFEALAHCHNPDSAFAKAIATQMLYSASFFILLPSLVGWLGINAFFITLAIFSIAMLLFPLQLSITEQYPKAINPNANYPLILTGLIALFMFMVVHSATWSMLGIFATELAVSEQMQGNILAIGTLFSLLGAILSSVFSMRLSDRRLTIVLALSLQAVVLYSLFNGVDQYQYMISVALFMLIWNFTVPLFLGAMAEADEGGEAMRLVVFVQTIGGAFGPSVLLQGWMQLEIFIFLAITLVSIYSLLNKLKQHQENRVS